MTRRTLIWIAATILVSMIGCTDSPRVTADQVNAANLTDPQLDGWYVGSSKTPAGLISWFLQVDSRTASGKVYLPPQILDLKNVVVTKDGKVSFQFENKVVANFKGNIDNGVTGKFSYSNGVSFETHLTRIETEWLTNEYANFAGLYSNVTYVEEAGDLVGAELLLVPQATGLGGSLTMYEGVPGNIHALTNVQIKDNTMSFATITSEGTKNYTAQLSTKRITIKETGNQDSESKPILLPKRKNLTESLVSKRTTVF